MGPLVARLKNADRIMTTATAITEGIELVFADGCRGVVPFVEIPEIGTLANLAGLELPNPYEVVLRDRRGRTVELPWDFVRHFCDPQYRARVEAIAQTGRDKRTNIVAGAMRVSRRRPVEPPGSPSAACRGNVSFTTGWVKPKRVIKRPEPRASPSSGRS